MYMAVKFEDYLLQLNLSNPVLISTLIQHCFDLLAPCSPNPPRADYMVAPDTCEEL